MLYISLFREISMRDLHCGDLNASSRIILCIEYGADIFDFYFAINRAIEYPFHREIGSSKQELCTIIENHAWLIRCGYRKAAGCHKLQWMRSHDRRVRNSTRIFTHFISNWIINRDLFLIEWHGMRQTSHTYVCLCIKKPGYVALCTSICLF